MHTYVYNEYIKRTEPLRENNTKLFISFVKPHNSVSKDTLSRWLKNLLSLSGIDTSIFVAYSVRSAACSAAHRNKVPINVILSSAGWSQDNTFKRFYKKTSCFGRTI